MLCDAIKLKAKDVWIYGKSREMLSQQMKAVLSYRNIKYV